MASKTSSRKANADRKPLSELLSLQFGPTEDAVDPGDVADPTAALIEDSRTNATLNALKKGGR